MQPAGTTDVHAGAGEEAESLPSACRLPLLGGPQGLTRDLRPFCSLTAE